MGIAGNEEVVVSVTAFGAGVEEAAGPGALTVEDKVVSGVERLAIGVVERSAPVVVAGGVAVIFAGLTFAIGPGAVETECLPASTVSAMAVGTYSVGMRVGYFGPRSRSQPGRRNVNRKNAKIHQGCINKRDFISQPVNFAKLAL